VHLYLGGCRVGAISGTSYAIELHKPYFEDGPPASGDWQLEIGGSSIPINWSGSRRFHVVKFEDPNAPLGNVEDFNDVDEPADPRALFGYSKGVAAAQSRGRATFSPRDTIYLQRLQRSGPTVTADSLVIPPPDAGSGWLMPNTGIHSIQRDITRHKCIRRIWKTVDSADPNTTLGRINAFVDAADPGLVQAYPYLDPAVYAAVPRIDGRRAFKNIGEIGKVLAVSGYDPPYGGTTADLLLDFRVPRYTGLLNYLTVTDPRLHGRGPIEKRIKGRVNVNTASAFVLEQSLPFVTTSRWASGVSPN